MYFRLRRLDCFEACSVQIGDKGFYILKETDTLQSVSSRGCRSLLRHIRKGLSGPDLADGDLAQSMNSKMNICDNKNISLVIGVHDVNGGNDPEVAKKKESDVKNLSHTNSILDPTNPVAGLTLDSDKQTANLTCSVEVNGISSNQSVNDEIGILGAPKNLSDSEYASLSDYEEEDGCLSDTGSAASGQSSPSTAEKKKKGSKKGVALQTKLLKKKKLKRARRKLDEKKEWVPKLGEKIPVEIIYTFSYVEVMWQVCLLLLQFIHSGY